MTTVEALSPARLARMYRDSSGVKVTPSQAVAIRDELGYGFKVAYLKLDKETGCVQLCKTLAGWSGGPCSYAIIGKRGAIVARY